MELTATAYAPNVRFPAATSSLFRTKSTEWPEAYDNVLPIRADFPIHGMPFGWIGFTAKRAERDGVAIRDALAKAGVASHIDDDTPIDPAEFLLMCALVINGVDDEMHGVSRSPMVRGTASMVCKATASEKTLAGAICSLARFFRMVGSFCEIQLDVGAGTACVKIRSNNEEGHPAHIIEELMAHFLQLQFSYLLDSPLPLSGFVTQSVRHPFLKRQHPYLLCPVSLGSVTSISFPSAYLDFECRAKVEELPLWDAQKFWLQHHPAMGSSPDAWRGSKDLSCSLYQMLQDATISIEQCSETLGISVSELRQSLAAEGTSFRQIRRDAIVARAKAHLESGTPTEDVALILGYSDGRSFRRAMKLAGGGSIQQLRTTTRLPQNNIKPKVLEQLRLQAFQMQ